ncbi:MAG: UDP-N-acetylmuramoyl-tripeptide--D-alanyl-D-alanine ligase [Idiomarinaceae bacterium]|nr:UDP-N-acetylmuramoyl-tripeptide--D-alanyl-D-alanine ligase [Idiomarinaceae bacterium]
MINVSLQWIAEKIDARIIGTDNAVSIVVDTVSTDTRKSLQGALFIALRGHNFDAHEFIQQAADQGAKAIICEKPADVDLPQLIVEDSRYALGQLGAAVKAEVAPKTVAITGSNGKTTVKEMLASILSQRHSVLATQGNFNNDIGVPLTLLRLTPEHEYAVIELGANHPGEIAYTTALTRPDVAILNNVSAAHVEGFGSIQGVARAKTEIFRGLPEDGLAITTIHSEFLPCWQRNREGKRWHTFGLDNNADVYATDVKLDDEGCASFSLNLFEHHTSISLQLSGRHNVLNALAASAAAYELGVSLVDIINGLEAVQPVAGRLTTSKLSEQVRLIDDTYNASVASTKAALDLLGGYKGYRIMVLGDMGELGPDSRAYHEEIGDHALQCDIDNLYTLGVLSQSASEVFNGKGGRHFSSVDELVAAILQNITQQHSDQVVTVLVKGSRSAQMERVVNALKQQITLSAPEDQHAC